MSFSDRGSATRVPGGFEELLYGMALEVLRAQPDDVLGFITHYFQALLAEREQSSAAQRAEDGETEGAEAEAEEAEARRSSAAVSRTVMERQRSPCDEDLPADLLTSQEAATKIQAAFRGFCTRRGLRGLRRAFSEPPCLASGPEDAP